jgi:drug/metabolite transporter (DMT)-like permease
MRSKVAFALFVLTTIITAATWFAGLQALPFATATSLFSLKAAFAMIGAAVLLGERLTTRRIGALILGFAGAAILLQPDRPSLGGAAWVLGAAASSALSGIFYAHLVRIDQPTRVLVTSALVQLVVLAPVTLLAAIDLPMPTLLMVGASAVLSIGVMYTLAWAYRGADVGLVGLLEYLRLPFAALLAYLFFAEQPGAEFYVGSAFIVAGVACAQLLTGRQGESK